MDDKRKLLGPALIGLAACAIGAGVLYYLAHSKQLPEGLIAASGRIEGERIVAAAKFPGRIVKIMAREGDAVTLGAPLVQLDDEQVKTRLEQAGQALKGAEAQLKAAESALAIARREVPLALTMADAGVSGARATLAKSEAVQAQAQRDAERYQDLFERGTVERHRAEQSALALRVAQTDVSAAHEAVVRAVQGRGQAGLGDARVRAREDEIGALRAQRDRALAAVAEATSIMNDLLIKAPASGVVLARLREPGEVVMPGSPVLEMVDLDALHLKVYVPEAQIGRVHLGQAVRLYIDALPDQPYAARVSYIAARAEFTPKEVQTTDERVKLVYAVKLAIDKNPEHRLTPGLPADALIRWKDNVEWQKPTW